MLESIKAQVAALIAQAEAGIAVEVAHLKDLASKVEAEAQSLMGLAGISHTTGMLTTGTFDAATINTGVEGAAVGAATTVDTAATDGATVEEQATAATVEEPVTEAAAPTLTITRAQLAQAFARWEEENGNKDTSASVGSQNADYMWAALQALATS